VTAKLSRSQAFKRSDTARSALVSSYLGAQAFILLSALLVGCSQQAPGGQVIAKVNGQEITPQDLQAEARSNPTLASADSSVLLQRVISREILAQTAHRKGLDNYPGYPSDIARLKQDFSAQKLIKASLKPLTPPTPAELDKVMADNPYYFAGRERVTVDNITIHAPASSVESLESLKYTNDILTRLTQLSVPFRRRTVVLDTSKVPAALAARLSTAPLGEPFFVRNDNQLSVMTPTARTPITAPPEEAAATAAQIFEGMKVQQQIDGLVGHLRSQAKIVYTNGFIPPRKAESTPAQTFIAPARNTAN
jgi:EpsD family peptidyl-prolyl cis-trans isomerase